MTVRWKESKPTTSPGRLFTAGYMLTSASGKQTDWCNFATLLFHTSDTAVAHALGQAHRFIDGQLAGRRQDT